MLHWNNKPISNITVGLTTHCNAGCPQCARTIGKGNYDLESLSIEGFKRAVPPEVMSELMYVGFCGSLGDPAMCPDALEIVEYTRAANPDCHIAFLTNGSIRDAGWWDALARAIGKKGHITFAVDGATQESHEKYRIGTKLAKVWENLSAAADTGQCMIDVQMLVYKHNEDEVEAIEAQAKRYGAAHFIAFSTYRFDLLGDQGNLQPSTKYPLKHVTRVGDDHGGISCLTMNGGRLAVDTKYHLLPCCWFVDYDVNLHSKAGSLRQLIDDLGGLEPLSLLTHAWQEILDGEFYKKLVAMWDCQKAPGVCKAMCAKNRSHIASMTAKDSWFVQKPSNATGV